MRAVFVIASTAVSYLCGVTTPIVCAQELFRDKTIRIVAGSATGGSHDTYARLVAKHLGAYLPGRPAIIVSNMPGASGAQIGRAHV